MSRERSDTNKKVPRTGALRVRGRVLVVEDEPGPRATLAAILGDEFEVVAVATAREAKQSFSVLPFDVVVTDHDLGPGETGSTVLTDLLRENPWLSGILLTGHSDYREVREVQRQGKFLVMFKPADPDQILAWVKNGIVMSNLARAKIAAPKHSAP